MIIKKIGVEGLGVVLSLEEGVSDDDIEKGDFVIYDLFSDKGHPNTSNNRDNKKYSTDQGESIRNVWKLPAHYVRFAKSLELFEMDIIPKSSRVHNMKKISLVAKEKRLQYLCNERLKFVNDDKLISTMYEISTILDHEPHSSNLLNLGNVKHQVLSTNASKTSDFEVSVFALGVEILLKCTKQSILNNFTLHSTIMNPNTDININSDILLDSHLIYLLCSRCLWLADDSLASKHEIAAYNALQLLSLIFSVNYSRLEIISQVDHSKREKIQKSHVKEKRKYEKKIRPMISTKESNRMIGMLCQCVQQTSKRILEYQKKGALSNLHFNNRIRHINYFEVLSLCSFSLLHCISLTHLSMKKVLPFFSLSLLQILDRKRKEVGSLNLSQRWKFVDMTNNLRFPKSAKQIEMESLNALLDWIHDVDSFDYEKMSLHHDDSIDSLPYGAVYQSVGESMLLQNQGHLKHDLQWNSQIYLDMNYCIGSILMMWFFRSLDLIPLERMKTIEESSILVSYSKDDFRNVHLFSMISISVLLEPCLSLNSSSFYLIKNESIFCLIQSLLASYRDEKSRRKYFRMGTWMKHSMKELHGAVTHLRQVMSKVLKALVSISPNSEQSTLIMEDIIEHIHTLDISNSRWMSDHEEKSSVIDMIFQEEEESQFSSENITSLLKSIVTGGSDDWYLWDCSMRRRICVFLLRCLREGAKSKVEDFLSKLPKG